MSEPLPNLCRISTEQKAKGSSLFYSIIPYKASKYPSYQSIVFFVSFCWFVRDFFESPAIKQQ